jgi:hypothetical protein
MVYRSEYLSFDRRDLPTRPRVLFEFPRYSPGAAAKLCSRCSTIDFIACSKADAPSFALPELQSFS